MRQVRSSRVPLLVGAVFSLVVALAALLPALAHPVAAQTLDPARYTQLRWRFIGPVGNRAIAVVGEPGNPLVAYVGAAAGGVFRTLDGGVTWAPVFDDQDVSSVSSLAVAPTAPNEVWAGTGEMFFIRGPTSMGNGIYRSTDRGEHWTRMGLEKTGRIGRIVVSPLDHNTVYACAVGDAYNRQQERGVFRTTDGGRTWQRVLFVDENTGCSDLNMDAHDPRTLFAGMWQIKVRKWKLDSGGPGSGIFVTHDGGDTWARVHGGLPEHPVGKTSVDVARTDPMRVYALIEDRNPSLYRSDDGGVTWRLMNRNHNMLERPSYYTRVRIDPADEDRIYFPSVRFTMSRDGGRTLAADPPRAGGDNHDMWLDPTDPDRMMVANDGGLTMSWNHGRTFDRVVLPIAQVYHVAVDTRVPYYVYGNRQDGPSWMAPSNNRMGRGITEGDWRNFGGCESGFGVPDTVTNALAWSGCYDGGLDVTDLETMHARNVEIWPESGIGWKPADVKYRWNWTFPITISPNDHNRVYVGSQVVHMTTNGGQSWKVISPDLTRNDKSHQQSSGGITTDNLMTFDGATLWSIAESELQDGLLWTGSNDGLVHVSRDLGAHWEDVTKNVPDLPPWGTISNIQPSHFDAGTAYISVDLHLVGNFDPYIYKTTDYGKSWKRISDAIPHSVLSNVHIVLEDPVRPGMLYAGTENAVYFSLDDGAHWMPLQNNLPHAPAYWLVVQPHFNDLVVGTYGRGFWIMDDITPLRALDASVMSAPAHLFQPRAAYRFRSVTGRGSAPKSFTRGRNPPYGADVNYWLGEKPEGHVKVEILDEAGATIRTLEGSADAGVNRVWWDLRHQGPERAVLRTAPPGEPWVETPPEGRPVMTWGSGRLRGPLVSPGTYTVRLTVAGQTFTQPLEVRKDPNTKGTLADIEAQEALSLRMQDELNLDVRMINRIEWTRRQLEDLRGALREGEGDDVVLAAADSLEDALLAVEGRLFDVHLTGGREDAFRHPMQLYGMYLEIMREVDGSGDHPPTDQQNEVHDLLRGRLMDAQAGFNDVMGPKLETFNQLLRSRHISRTITDAP